MTHPLFGFIIRTGRSLLVGVAVVILAGCGAGKDESRTAGGSDSPVSDSPVSASPTSRAAADGTDLKACEDGTCEVKVTGPAKIPVDREKFKIFTLKVKPVDGDKVTFVVEDPRPASSLSVRVCERYGRCSDFGGGGYASGGENQSAESKTGFTVDAGAQITVNRLFITVLSVADGSAILRLRPA